MVVKSSIEYVGVKGSGHVFRVRFRARAAGVHRVRVWLGAEWFDQEFALDVAEAALAAGTPAPAANVASPPAKRAAEPTTAAAAAVAPRVAPLTTQNLKRLEMQKSHSDPHHALRGRRDKPTPPPARSASPPLPPSPTPAAAAAAAAPERRRRSVPAVREACSLCAQPARVAISGRQFCSSCLDASLLRAKSSPLYGLREDTVHVALQLVHMADSFEARDAAVAAAEALSILQFATERQMGGAMTPEVQAHAAELHRARTMLEPRVSELLLLTMLAEVVKFAKLDAKRRKKKEHKSKQRERAASPAALDPQVAASTVDELFAGIFSGDNRADAWCLY